MHKPTSAGARDEHCIVEHVSYLLRAVAVFRNKRSSPATRHLCCCRTRIVLYGLRLQSLPCSAVETPDHSTQQLWKIYIADSAVHCIHRLVQIALSTPIATQSFVVVHQLNASNIRRILGAVLPILNSDERPALTPQTDNRCDVGQSRVRSL